MVITQLKKTAPTTLAPASIDLNATASSLDAIRFERDAKLLDLQIEFTRRRDQIQAEFLNATAAITQAGEEAE